MLNSSFFKVLCTALSVPRKLKSVCLSVCLPFLTPFRTLLSGAADSPALVQHVDGGPRGLGDQGPRLQHHLRYQAAVPGGLLPAAPQPLQRHRAPVAARAHARRHLHLLQRPELQRGLLLLPVPRPAGGPHLHIQGEPAPAHSRQR